MTTGASTRRALRASGARAASSRGVVHLPATPERTPEGLGVLAHELSHAADNARPRLFGEGLLDLGERRARGVGRAVQSAAGGARSAARGAEQRMGAALAQGEGLLERPPISSLPIGGAGAALPAAVRAAEGVVSDAQRASSSAAESAASFAGEGLAAGRRAADTALGTAQRGLAGAAGGVGEAFGELGQRAGEIRHGAEDAVGGARAAIGSAGSQAAALNQAGHVDAMIEAIEQRLLAELERRGGRFQGLF